jgi:hypothetical protein
VAAQQQRADNQAYLSTNNINSDRELAGVIGERIQAERELNEALQPLKQTLASFDLGLTRVATQMLRFSAGRNVDGTEKTEQQKMQDRMTTTDLPVDTAMVGTHDYSSINGSVQRQGGPIGKFYNWLFDVPDHSLGAATQLKVPEQSLLGLNQLALKMDGVLKSLDAGDMANGEYRRFRPDAFEVFDAKTALKLSQPQSQVEYPGAQQTSPATPGPITTNHITAPVNITINPKSEASAEDIGKVSREAVRDEMGKIVGRINIDNSESQ